MSSKNTNETTTASSLTYSFSTTCTAATGYAFVSPPTITPIQPNTGIINGSQTIVTTITGTLVAVP